MASRVRGIAGLATIGALALAISSCGAPPETTSGQTGGAEGAADVKACLVSDEGGFQDKSFNQSAYEGLQRAVSELGVDSATAESHSSAEYAPNIENLIAQNCTLIIGVGFTINDAVRDAARANPDLQFALIDSRITENNEVIELDNAKPLVFYTAEAAYAAGYLAAGMTKTGNIGTWGGMQIPAVSIFMDGLADGINRYNADNNTDVHLIGWDKQSQRGSFSGDFSDTTAGTQLSANMISQGADIIFPVAGNASNGALAAAKDAGNTSIIWVDSDGFETTADGNIILTSVMKEIGAAVFDTIESSVNGEFSSEPYIGTLENGGVGLAPYHDFDSQIPDELKSQVEAIIAEISDGTTVVETSNQP